jgi:hypothetical protein
VIRCRRSSLGRQSHSVVRDACWNATAALSLGPIVMIPMMIFGGLFLNADNVPKYLIWLERVSFFKYGYMGLMRNEHLGASYYCKPGTLSFIYVFFFYFF